MKKKAVMLVMAAMLAAASVTGCSSFDGDAAAITVGDKKVTADEANFYARYTQAQYETYYGSYMGEDMWNTEASEGKVYEEAVKAGIQEDMERMILFEQHMKDYDVTLTDAEKEVIKKSAATFAEDNGLENKEKVSGDDKTVKRVLTLLAIRSKVQSAIEAGADTEVSDEEAAQKSMQYVLFSYTKTGEDGKSSELTDEEKKALKESAGTFAADAKGGKDFAALAQENSLEVQTATFDAESTAPDADLVKAADALQVNETTEVIETDAGCYVAKVTSLLDADATNKKKEEIVSKRKSDLVDDTCKKWKKDMKVDVKESVWDKIDFSELSVTMKLEETEPYADKVQTDDQAEAKEEAK